MSKHTPGPWCFQPNEYNNKKIGISNMKWRDIGKTPPAGYLEIAEVKTRRSLFAPKDYDEPIANARLISSAPELLETLKIALDQLERSYEVTGGDHGNGVGLPTIKIVKKVISKAEGKTDE